MPVVPLAGGGVVTRRETFALGGYAPEFYSYGFGSRQEYGLSQAEIRAIAEAARSGIMEAEAAKSPGRQGGAPPAPSVVTQPCPGLDAKLSDLDKRIDALKARIDTLDAKVTAIYDAMARARQAEELKAMIAEVTDPKFKVQGELLAKIVAQQGEQIKTLTALKGELDKQSGTLAELGKKVDAQSKQNEVMRDVLTELNKDKPDRAKVAELLKKLEAK
jgi:DNA repair exonuclease SbcCD ATPase subunit